MGRSALPTLRAVVARIARVRAVRAHAWVPSRLAGAVAALLVMSGALGAQTYTLTIRAGTGTGSGGVTVPATGGQAAMNCAVANGVTSGTCARTYARATVVTLTATALTGSVFTGWTGACAAAGAATSCTVRNLTGAQSAIASFAPSCAVSVTAGAGGSAAVTAGGATGACGPKRHRVCRTERELHVPVVECRGHQRFDGQSIHIHHDGAARPHGELRGGAAVCAHDRHGHRWHRNAHRRHAHRCLRAQRDRDGHRRLGVSLRRLV